MKARHAFELAGFLLPGVLGWCAGSHAVTMATLGVYWLMHVAGVQRAYLIRVNRQ